MGKWKKKKWGGAEVLERNWMLDKILGRVPLNLAPPLTRRKQKMNSELVRGSDGPQKGQGEMRAMQKSEALGPGG